MSSPDQTKDDAPTASKGTNYLAAVGTLAATVSLVLLLLGYGVSLAVESTFGIPHATLYESPTEIIELGHIAVTALLTRGGGATLEFLRDGYAKGWLLLIVMATIVAVVFGGVALWKKYKKPQRSADCPSKVASKLRPWLLPTALIAGIVFGPVLTALFALLVVAAGVVLCILPFIGMHAGTVHLQEWVVAPPNCRPAVGLSDGIKGRVVECVVVRKPSDDPEKPDAILGEGRVVVATAKSIVLWIPKEHARRIPISDAVVEPVSSIRQAKGLSQSKDGPEAPMPAPSSPASGTP